jgi:putative CocE/NonD family hydrolase
MTTLPRLPVVGPGVLLVMTLALAQDGVLFIGAQVSQATYIREANVDVPMRDGVRLRADILRPIQGPSPTLVYRTPYGKHAALEDHTIFGRAVARGYAVVVQDVRGRYASDGNFRPYENEGHDGYDTIEWASQQPWSNGRVGTFGLSYPGAVQWLAAAESPPHLTAMVPAMTFSTPRNFFYSGGVWDLSWLEWIWVNIAPDARKRKGLPNPADPHPGASWPALRDRWLRTLPLDQVQELHEVAPYYYDWLHHPPSDAYWDFAELRNKYGRTQAAVLNLSGWHDDNYGPEGATTNYQGIVMSRSGDTSRAAVLLGPWTHGVDSTSRTTFGERDFGPDAIIEYDQVVLGWMDRHLRGDGMHVALAPVRYFVMGQNRWQESSTWPPRGNSSTYYFLRGEGSTHGSLTPTPPTRTARPSTFVSDPADPVINAYYGSAGAHDYRALAGRRDVLTFDSAPLTRDLEVTGPIRVRVHISCDCRDTDLWVRILDVAPDGAAFNLMSPGVEVVRASYRDLPGPRRLLVPGRVYALALDNLVTSNLFRRGHRIRAQVSASFFPNFSRNLHTGDLETVSGRMKRATIHLHHDRDHPSQITLPIAGR